MSQYNFQLLIQKYLRGECSKDELQLIDKWYNVLSEQSDVSLSAEELKDIKTRIWTNISNEIEQKEAFETDFRASFLQRPVFKYGIAASLTILLSVFAYQYFMKTNTTLSHTISNKILPKIGGFMEEENLTDKPERIKLEDGSVITLNPQSSISFPKHFAKDKREVFLSGDAFFEIAKNPKRPFFVYSGDVVTQVLGTSFYIKAADDTKAIEVDVRTGRVSVYKKGADAPHALEKEKDLEVNGVILTPNQKVTYFPENSHWVTGIVAKPMVIAQVEKTLQLDLGTPDASPMNANLKFRFEESSLREVASKLEQAYGIEIVLEKEDLSNCTFTGDISTQPLFTQLELICKAVNATYEIRGTKILISGKGCNP